jgi:hypothetical protein
MRQASDLRHATCDSSHVESRKFRNRPVALRQGCGNSASVGYERFESRFVNDLDADVAGGEEGCYYLK